MKPTLQEKLSMLWRQENPNYLIIVKNKAGAGIDFSKFTTVEEQPIPEPVVKRIRVIEHEIRYINQSGIKNSKTVFKVTVFLTRKVCCNIEIINTGEVARDADKFTQYLSKLKSEYSGSLVIEDIDMLKEKVEQLEFIENGTEN